MNQVINTGLLYALNPEYAEAVARGEPWALKHAHRVESINNGEPEGMRRKFDGKPRKWCGLACSHKEGCIVCTLPENAQVAQNHCKYGQGMNGPKGRRRQGSSYSGDGTDDEFI